MLFFSPVTCCVLSVQAFVQDNSLASPVKTFPDKYVCEHAC